MGAIKDSVHGYIELSDFERRIIDTPWFQRLKHVRQNDVSSTVYPTMHTRRFEHSLGAMHVAGSCIEAALMRSGSDNVGRFLRALWSDLFSPQPYDEEAASSAAAQIARLYGLLHDVGHPPFSHLLERSIAYTAIYPDKTFPDGKVPERAKKWHELNGVDLINDKIASVATTDREKKYIRVAADLLRNEGLSPALRGVQSLVDAVIDTDRMDFVARDGRASGAEFGRYDIGRLIDSFRVVVDGTDTIASVHIRPSIKALSAIESLLLERHKLYRWVFFHHRVMLSKALTRVIVERLSSGLGGERFEPADYRVDNHFCLTEDRPYGMLGDAHIEAQLWRLLKRLASPADEDEAFAKSALRVLLLRDRLAIALWKDRDEYDRFDRVLQERFRQITTPPDAEAIERKHGSYANWLGDYVVKHGDLGRSLFEKVASRLSAANKGWFLMEATEGFSTKGKDELIAGNGRQAISLGQFSSVARGVVEAWRKDIHLYAFYLGRETQEASLAARETHRSTLAGEIVSVFENDQDEQRNLRRFLDASA